MNGPMAQLVAHLHGMQGVRGSNPLRSTAKYTLPNREGVFALKINLDALNARGKA
jgi:hypothetical protein